jgi:anti-sigma B factor antagonist
MAPLPANRCQNIVAGMLRPEGFRGEMDLEYSIIDGQIVIRPQGELGMFSVTPLIQAYVDANSSTGHSHAILDFSKVPLVDSCGLGALVSILRKAEEKGGTITLAGLRQGVMELLNITKLSTRFRCFATVDEALASGRPAA